MQPTLNRVGAMTVQVAQIGIPIALSVAIDVGMRDKRIGKIFAGVVFILGGMFCTVVGINRTVNAFDRWSPSQNKTAAKKTINIAITLMGIAAITYGFMQIAIHFMGYDDRCYTVPCEERIEQLKQQMLSCPEGVKLWRAVNREGPVSIKCKTFEELRQNRAASFPKTREIHLAYDITSLNDPNQPSDFIFELFNMKQAKQMLALIKKACSLSPQQYVESMYRIEYASSTGFTQAIERCIDFGAWPQAWKAYEEQNAPARSTFEIFQKNHHDLGHAKYYYENWQIMCSPIFSSNPFNQFHPNNRFN